MKFFLGSCKSAKTGFVDVYFGELAVDKDFVCAWPADESQARIPEFIAPPNKSEVEPTLNQQAI